MPRVRASGTVGVQVQGLNELNRALRALGGRELQGEIRAAGKDVATEVSSDARGKAYSLGGVAAHVAPSIAASAGVTSAGVSLGGASFPAAMGAEFGGQGRPTTQQFKPWRGSGSGAGYFVYPAIRDNADMIAERYGDALDKIVRKYL
jgi:hypothetical protein